MCIFAVGITLNSMAMQKDFIGRKDEIKMLHSIMESGKSEFVSVYGRRRVGKTYMIQNFFDNNYTFSATGIIGGNKEEELFAFATALVKYGYEGTQPDTWLKAFEALKNLLDQKLIDGRCVIYLDELPCFDTPKSGFVRALGYFWNTWAAVRNDVVLIVCGSAISWMIENIVNNHGGLHDRTTHTIYLRQFNLCETEQYLKTINIYWPRQIIVETYMMLGGIPFYLSLLNPEESLAQNIDRIYFKKNSELSLEYKRLYGSLFKSPEPYIKIVEVLGKNKMGLTRGEIADALKISSSGTLSDQLENLEYCDIIRRYVTKVNGKPKNNEAYFQLVDLFTLFHLNFGQKLTTDDYWEQRVKASVVNAWQGLAFEHVCMVHIRQIRHTLGLDRIAVEYYSWRSNTPPRAQIDMIIERADRLINVCEIKYTSSEYEITADEDLKFRNRTAAFARQSKTKIGTLPTWITPFGLLRNQYAANVQYQVTMDDLFAE